MHSAGEQQVAATATDEFTWRPRTSQLPAAADALIIGGGIIGCSAAWFLARRGMFVVLCEKGRIAGEQSGRNWGWVRQQGRAPQELPMMQESLRIWRTLAEQAGEDIGFRQGGCLYLARDAAELAEFAEWLGTAREYRLDSRLLTAAELTEVLAGAAGRWVGALYTASDGRAEPNRAVAAIARAARRAGAHIFTQCAVRGIEAAGGRLQAVITEHGCVRTPVVVCAAGVWTSLFARSLGIRVPQLKLKGTVARTAPTVRVTGGTAYSRPVAIRRREDGGYTVAHGGALEHDLTPDTLRYAPKFLPALRQERGAIRLHVGREFLRELQAPQRWPLDRPSPFEGERVLRVEPSKDILAEIGQALACYFPEIAAAPLVETWAGMIEASPDVLPIISGTSELDGFIVATGFSGHGFGIGPGAGKVIAELASGAEPSVDVRPFRLQRFFDGSPIRPGPSI